jgi:two-component system sensor histidine kinase QseC
VVVADAPREMQPMLLALNDLLGRIGALMEGERRFTADAAHELRTPVAAIRMQAQVALREVDDALRRQALTATVAGCDRAARLVDQMLTLSRMESGHAPALALVDLAALARQVAADLAPQALARAQHLSVDAPQTPCLVQGDATLLSVMLRNLLDNAIRYSPSGGQVEVRLTADAQGVRCAVQDTGPGLDDAALARLGERFFRVLGSGESGSGLGWSIVRRVATLHGATVTARRAEPAGGLLAEVSFPPAS